MTALAPYFGSGVYLDYNATTPVDPRVLADILPYLSANFGNPSSGHRYGDAARRALETARSTVAGSIGAPPGTVVFTASGSESNALALAGATLAHARPGRRTIVMQATEHPSVLNTCAALRRRHGFHVVGLPVDGHGQVDLDAARAAIDRSTVLVSVQYANGETGTVQPVAELARMAHARGALMHTDAAQAMGRLAVDVTELDVDLLTVVGHKMYAPKGIAALYRRSGVQLEPLVDGGGQEGGVRSGTENVAFAVGLATACAIAGEELSSESARLRRLRDRLHDGLRRVGRAVHLNGHPTQRLPNTLNLSIDGIDSRGLLATTPELASSTGSACHAGSETASPVLRAMGLSEERARGALRLTLGRWSTAAEVDRAVHMLVASVARLHEVAGVQR